MIAMTIMSSISVKPEEQFSVLSSQFSGQDEAAGRSEGTVD